MQVVSAWVAAQQLRRYRQGISLHLLKVKLTLRNSCHKIILQSHCL